MLTWSGHGVPRYLVKHCFWVCLWGCFWMRLAFESVGWVKQIALPSVGGPQPVCWASEWNKNTEERIHSWPDYLSWHIGLLLHFGLKLTSPTSLVLRPSDLNWNYTRATRFPGSPSCRPQTMTLPSLHNLMSQYFIKISPHPVYICVYIHIYTHIVSLDNSDQYKPVNGFLSI